MAQYKDIVASYGPDKFIKGNIKTANIQVSTHFKADEFACPDCGEYKIHIDLLQGIEDLRTLLGDKAITVVNPKAPGGQGYRCKKYAMDLAKRMPGVASKTTKHNDGTAADLHQKGIQPTAFRDAALKIPVFAAGGVGIYTWGVHVDLGPKRRWDYRGK